MMCCIILGLIWTELKILNGNKIETSASADLLFTSNRIKKDMKLHQLML